MSCTFLRNLDINKLFCGFCLIYISEKKWTEKIAWYVPVGRSTDEDVVWFALCATEDKMNLILRQQDYNKKHKL